ncbi:MAG: GTPase ObgE, partial [Marinirhabdus sp.]
MTEGNFVDYVKIQVTSGKGGKGSAHLRREKFVPKGGPDGGDGGRGGHIILRANKNMWTLLHLKYKRHYKAGQGGDGGKQTSTGANGSDVYIEVPLGTVVKNTTTGKVLEELLTDGQELIIAKG